MIPHDAVDIVITKNKPLYFLLILPYCVWCSTSYGFHTKLLQSVVYWLDSVTEFLVHGPVTIIFVESVCLSVCLCRVFLSRLRSDLDQTGTHVTCLDLVVSPRI